MSKSSPAIKKPDLDKRSYRIITLSNKLRCLLCSDPKTDKSSAALSCNVGADCDPDDLPGLAHFLEHLLFMGTEKYPSENEYSKYLSEANGSSNAFTARENTCYYFDCSPEAFEGALDRFAQFFIAPLFREDCTDRELLAVDSEHKKNLQDDDWRLSQLFRDISSKSHPFHKFSTGDLQTLKVIPEAKGINVRQALLEFHEKYYSANIMSLVVFGKGNFVILINRSTMFLTVVKKESLDELETWVNEKFSGIKNKDVPVPAFPGKPFTNKELGKILRGVSIDDKKTLELTFPIPNQKEIYPKKPVGYIAHLIGHEGEGSILSALKNRGWASELGAYNSNGGIGYDFFEISIGLTNEGMENYQKVVQIVFNYINMIRSETVQKWIHDEIAVISDLEFRFMEPFEPISFTNSYVCMMNDFPDEDILFGAYTAGDYAEAEISEYLECLKADNMIVFLTSKEQDESKEWKVAEWYGTKYCVEEITPEFLNFVKTLEPYPELHLPAKNLFLPENLEVSPQVETRKVPGPKMIHGTPEMRVWHKKDDVFLLPRNYTVIYFRTPLARANAKTRMLFKAYLECVSDALTEYKYFASVAGADISIQLDRGGFMLSVCGFCDKLLILLETVVKKMHPNPTGAEKEGFKIKPERFAIIMEQLIRHYRNFENENPDSHAHETVDWIFEDGKFRKEDLLAEALELTATEVDAFAPLIFSNLYMEILVHGNFLEEEALKVAEIFTKYWKVKPLDFHNRLQNLRTYMVPEGSDIILTQLHPNESNLNSAVEYTLQFGYGTEMEKRINLAVFGQIASEPAFDQLRTKEQLGYQCYAYNECSNGVLWYRVSVQSEKDPVFVESRIEAFLEGMREMIVEMTPETFQNHITALRASLLETDKQMYSEMIRYWRHITDGNFDFNIRAELEGYLDIVTKESVLELYDKYISPYVVKDGKGDEEQRPYVRVGEASWQLRGPGVKEMKERNKLERKKLSVHVRSQQLDNGKLSEDEKNAVDDVLRQNNVQSTFAMMAHLKATWSAAPLPVMRKSYWITTSTPVVIT
ncbi:Insulinase (Peptidase M16) [Nowakowskiella sp. JEL0407]|nr:Insulinase (Peptidase M16) [Nowakowskiella sp. JEL0407]